MISIQCDEHIKRSVAEGLKARGIVVYRVEDEDIKGVSDEDLLKYCKRKMRVILTNDEDFLKLSTKLDHHGIIFITTQFASVGDIIMAVVKLLDTCPDKSFRNSKFFVP